MCSGRDEEGGGWNMLNPLAIGKTSEAINQVHTGDPNVKFGGSPMADLFENRRLLHEMINNMDR